MWIYINVFLKFHLNTLHFTLLLSLLIPFTNFLFRARIHVHAFGMKIFTNAMRFHHCYINLESARGSKEVLYNTEGTVNIWLIDRLNIVLRSIRKYVTWDVLIAGEGLQNRFMFWAGRDLYRATSAMTRGLGFRDLNRRTTLFSHLLHGTLRNLTIVNRSL